LKRYPNPWIAIPALALGALGAVLGWVVTEVSCSQPDLGGAAGSCPGWATLVSVVSFFGVTIGVALMLSLVFRSLAEWRERR